MARRENKENSAGCHDPLAAIDGLQAPLHARAGTLKRKASRLHSDLKSLSKKSAVSLVAELPFDASASVAIGDVEAGVPGEDGRFSDIVGKAKRAIKRKCSELGLGKDASSKSGSGKSSKNKENASSSSSRSARVTSLRRHLAHDARSIDLLSDATVIVLPSEDNYHSEAPEHSDFHADRSTQKMLRSADSTLLESQLTMFAPSSPPLFATAFEDGFFGFEDDADGNEDHESTLLPPLACEPDVANLSETLIDSVDAGNSVDKKLNDGCIASLDVNSLVAFIDEETFGCKHPASAAVPLMEQLPAAVAIADISLPVAEPKTPAAAQQGATPKAYSGEDTPLVEQEHDHTARTPGRRLLSPSIFIESQATTLVSSDKRSCCSCACSTAGFCKDAGSLGMYTEHADLLFKLEDKYITELESGLHRHPKLSAHMRPILIDWLCEIASHYRLHRQTLQLAVQYLDRFMMNTDLEIKPKQLQCYGMACLSVAIKAEEKNTPSMKLLTACADGAFLCQELKEAEREVVLALDWHLAVPTMFDFLTLAFQRAALELPELFADTTIPAANKAKQQTEVCPANVPRRFYARLFIMACDIADALLHNQSSQRFLGSELAATCFYLTAEHHGVDRDVFERCTGYPLESVQPAIDHTKRLLGDLYMESGPEMGSVQCCETKGRLELQQISPDQLWAYQPHHTHLLEEFERSLPAAPGV
ncbi:G1/S-specific cyclin-E2 [Coemansia sp. RSA 1722]|nr:G1/S-specific cyclin-E2 [Coemansia sp. RSA 485]KAJ2606619.1 G1/S-specific cyclin-E2 [Coemansia sp. RSA 1722]